MLVLCGFVIMLTEVASNTASSALLIPVFIAVFYVPFDWNREVATGVFILAALTDWLDGYLARRLKLVSALGAFLDPVADKLMVAIGLLVLATFSVGATPLYLIPASVILTREILISGLREYLGEVKLHVTQIAKWKKQDIEDYDAKLSLGGRIEREHHRRVVHRVEHAAHHDGAGDFQVVQQVAAIL